MPVVSIGKDLQEVSSLPVAEWGHVPVVHNQDILSGEGREAAVVSSVGLCDSQFLEEPVGACIEDAVTFAAPVRERRQASGSFLRRGYALPTAAVDAGSQLPPRHAILAACNRRPYPWTRGSRKGVPPIQTCVARNWARNPVLHSTQFVQCARFVNSPLKVNQPDD